MTDRSEQGAPEPIIPLGDGEIAAAEHIELDHERELAPGTEGIRAMHARMHRERSDWGHTHMGPARDAGRDAAALREVRAEVGRHLDGPVQR